MMHDLMDSNKEIKLYYYFSYSVGLQRHGVKFGVPPRPMSINHFLTVFQTERKKNLSRLLLSEIQSKYSVFSMLIGRRNQRQTVSTVSI